MNVRIGSIVRPNGLLILCKKGSVYYFLIFNPNRLMRRKWTFYFCSSSTTNCLAFTSISFSGMHVQCPDFTNYVSLWFCGACIFYLSKPGLLTLIFDLFFCLLLLFFFCIYPHAFANKVGWEIPVAGIPSGNYGQLPSWEILQLLPKWEILYFPPF